MILPKNDLNDFSDSIVDAIRMSISTVSILILLDSRNYFLAQCFVGNYDDLNGFKSKLNRHLVPLDPFY